MPYALVLASIERLTGRSQIALKRERAGWYVKARDYFKADKDFGNWLSENGLKKVSVNSPANERTESQPVIFKLMLCHEYFTEAQFMAGS